MEKTKVRVNTDTDKPLLLVKLGSKNNFTFDDPWIPDQQQMKMLAEHFEKIVGDKYQILIFHNMIELQTLDGEDLDIKVLEITSLEEFKEELNASK